MVFESFNLQVGGVNILVAGQYQVSAIKPDGSLLWKIDSPRSGGNSRVWADIAIAEINGVAPEEVVVAWANGFVGVFNAADGTPLSTFNGGAIKQISHPTKGALEFRSLATADLDGDGKAEIALGMANSEPLNLWVVNSDGSIRTGFLRAQSSEDGYSAGVNAVMIDNLDADNNLEIVQPSDVTYSCAYKHDGTPVPASPTGGWKAKSPGGAAPKWGHISFSADNAIEQDSSNNCNLGGYPNRNPERTNMANAGAVSADIDGDGTREIVVVGLSHTWCQGGAYIDVESCAYIVNKDRTRFVKPLMNWQDPPQRTFINGTARKDGQWLGKPLTVDFNIIQSTQHEVVVSDLDGDNILEILFPAQDGKLHCFWADGTEKFNWPAVAGNANAMRFMSSPVIADLDNDGFAEVSRQEKETPYHRC